MVDDRDIDLEAIMATFLREVDDILNGLEEGLVHLEVDTGNNDLLQKLFRYTHSLKGNAGMMGFDQLADLAHRMENVLQPLRDKKITVTPALVSLLLSAVDLLRRKIPEVSRGDPQPLSVEEQELLKKLAKSARGKMASSRSHTQDRRRPSAERRTVSTGRRKDDLKTLTAQKGTLHVTIGRLDRLLNLASELVVSRERLKQLLGKLARAGNEEIFDVYKQEDRIYSDLQEQILKIRMVPLGPFFRQYFRTVRDLSMTLGKQVSLTIGGEDVEVDTLVVDNLRDPLTHLIRNAIDHGIENQADRKAKGKEPTGNLHLSARHETGCVVIELRDDGRGLQKTAILEKAAKLKNMGDLKELSDEEVYRLIFQPGFSTSSEVTAISGRGVGMDVVQKAIEHLRGKISLQSEENHGTNFRIQLPLTLAIIEGFIVGVGEQYFVVPLETVTECLRLPDKETAKGGKGGFLSLRGKILPFLRLNSLLGSSGGTPNTLKENVIVVKDQLHTLGVVVNALHGTGRVVIKPLTKALPSLPWVAGSTILGTGHVALILDIPSLLQRGKEITREFADPGVEPPIEIEKKDVRGGQHANN